MNRLTHVFSEMQGRIRKLFHYWFVQYNPLYFVSALCVLFGMFLVSRGLGEMGWTKGQIILTVVIQAYEILLITGSAILFCAAGERRPGVILGLLEVFFLFDCTFQTEIVASLEGFGVVLTFLWLAMTGLKLTALIWIFRLKMRPAVLMLPVLAAIGLGGTPHLIQSEVIAKYWAHLIATWLGFGLVYAVLFIRPKVTSAISLDNWGKTVLRRSIISTFMIWAGFYFYHVITWFGLFHIGPMLAHLAPFILLFVFHYKTEKSVWWCSSISFLLTLLQLDSITVSPVALMIGSASGLQAWRLGRRRLYVGAIVFIHIAIWTIGWSLWPPPQQKWWLNLSTGMVLLAMAWRMRLTSALVVAILGMLPVLKKAVLAALPFFKTLFSKIYLLIKGFLPRGPLGWGILLLVIGFAALIIGVAINWSQRQRN